MRPPSRSTAAIIAAVLAACGGAVSVVPVDDERAAPSNDGEGRITSNEADGRVTPVSAEEATIDAAADTIESMEAAIPLPSWDGAPCPPASDPYWDEVFAGYPSVYSTSADAEVCGFYPGLGANGELACVLEIRYPLNCPRYICASPHYGINGGYPCRVQNWAADGAITPLIDDAGNCLVGNDTYFAVGCGQAGRRPNMFDPPRVRGRDAAACFLARQAALERASVTAFVELVEELRAFGAPAELIDACLRAADEESEHARITTELAVRFGGELPDAEPSPAPRRTLARCAIDNAVEGLVRETLAAAIALHQARSAAPWLRSDLARIARDEISHADLSRRIHAWTMRTLDADARAAVASAMQTAIDELASEIAVDRFPRSTAFRELGMPDAASVRTMFDALTASIWRTELAALA
jgi:hypothetical protein